MASRQRKVERKRQRRKEHRREERVIQFRQQQRLAGDTHPIHACIANRDWRTAGKASIFFARRVGTGRLTMAAFLVDTWAMGLKDAWGRVDIPAGEFDDLVQRYHDEIGCSRIDVGLARHLVYGGIRLAEELGFRLPRKYERWTAILGPLPAGESPDRSLFLPDGRIRLVCSEKDLTERLMGTSPGNFLERSDVDHVIGDDDFTLMDDEPDPVDEASEMLENAMIARVTQWCFANGQEPHPLLSRVVHAVCEGIIQSAPPPPDTDDDEIPALSDEQRDEMCESMDGFIGASFDHDKEGFEAAMAQVTACMGSEPSGQSFGESLGLDVVDESDDED